MKVLFYLGHPAHFHLFKNLFKCLEKNGDNIFVTLKTKDVLEDLLRETGIEYRNIYPSVRKQDILSILGALFVKNMRLAKIAFRFKPHLMLGTSIEIAEVGRLLGIPSVIVNEDDFDVVPQFARLGYPFANHIVAPNCCRVGKWSYKKIGYDGYHELAYLNPRYFTPDKTILHKYKIPEDRYYIIRFSQLKAYHDERITGITAQMAKTLISRLQPYGRVYITSECQLDQQLEKYRLSINPADMHHVLAFADIYIGDSQTMAAEAAVLGTPSLRFNDFVGRIGYLDELEFKHNLTFGIKTSQPENLFAKLDELLKINNLKELWRSRVSQMLAGKTDLTLLLYWLIRQYPQSCHSITENDGKFSEELIEKEFTDQYNSLLNRI